MKQKVVLAYSGGLDTTYCAIYLTKELNMEVHAVTVQTGGFSQQELEDITLQEATQQCSSFNTIAVLVYHINYYVDAVIKVFQGGVLEAKDEYSFSHPALLTEEDWQTMLQKMWNDAEVFAGLIEQLPEEMLWENFTDEKYGTYYRNIQGIIEHTHYHLGQIVLIKKLIR